jgi:hypothetical protein
MALGPDLGHLPGNGRSETEVIFVVWYDCTVIAMLESIFQQSRYHVLIGVVIDVDRAIALVVRTARRCDDAGGNLLLRCGTSGGIEIVGYLAFKHNPLADFLEVLIGQHQSVSRVFRQPRRRHVHMLFTIVPQITFPVHYS